MNASLPVWSLDPKGFLTKETQQEIDSHSIALRTCFLFDWSTEGGDDLQIYLKFRDAESTGWNVNPTATALYHMAETASPMMNIYGSAFIVCVQETPNKVRNAFPISFWEIERLIMRAFEMEDEKRRRDIDAQLKKVPTRSILVKNTFEMKDETRQRDIDAQLKEIPAASISVGKLIRKKKNAGISRELKNLLNNHLKTETAADCRITRRPTRYSPG